MCTSHSINRNSRLAAYDFIIILRNAARLNVRSARSPITQRKKRVLIVDNELDLTTLFKKALEKGGFDVDTFNDPKKALKNFEPHSYDLVILDIVMPAMDGFKLYNQLRKIDPGFNILFLTASEKHRDILTNEGYTKDLFLYKPISIIDLLKEVNNRVYGKN